MKLTLSKIVNCFGLPNEVGMFNDGAIHRLSKMKFSMKAAYQVKRNMDRIGKEMDAFVAARSDIIKKYGSESGDGSFRLSPDMPGWPEYQRDMDELMRTEIDIDIFMIDPNGVHDDITINDLAALEFMFSSEEATDVPGQNNHP